MDLIATLSSQLGIPADQAQAVAGGVLGMVKGQVDDAGDGETAAAFEQAVPELSQWQDAAKGVAEPQEQSGGLGGLMGGLMGGGGAAGALGGLMGGGGGAGALGALAGAIGGEDAKNTALLVGVLGKVGLDSSKAAMVAPIAYNFLKGRLPEGVLGKVSAAAPFLTKFL